MFAFSKSLSSKMKSGLTAAAAAALVGFAALPGTVQAFNSPFTAMSGSWSGSGTITTSSGNKERSAAAPDTMSTAAARAST